MDVTDPNFWPRTDDALALWRRGSDVDDIADILGMTKRAARKAIRDAQIIERHHAGQNAEVIGRALGCSARTVVRAIRARYGARWLADHIAQRRAEVRARSLAGESMSEIARALGCSARTVSADRALDNAWPPKQ